MRQQVRVVLQDAFLFSGTVAENICYAKPGAADAEVAQAARVAQAHEFVMGFPDRKDALVGERDQRLSISCAILHDPRIPILDLETEERIHAGLATPTRGRTLIAIAHRLTTKSRAIRLVVMEEGYIEEMGSRRELMTTGGRFLTMVEAQRTLGETQTLSHA